MFNDCKTQKVISALNKIQTIELKQGGKHNIKICAIHNDAKFPLPASHPKIKKSIIEKLAKWLDVNSLCTKEDFSKML